MKQLITLQLIRGQSGWQLISKWQWRCPTPSEAGRDLPSFKGLLSLVWHVSMSHYTQRRMGERVFTLCLGYGIGAALALGTVGKSQPLNVSKRGSLRTFRQGKRDGWRNCCGGKGRLWQVHSCKKRKNKHRPIFWPKKLAPKLRGLQHFQIRDKSAQMPLKLGIFMHSVYFSHNFC